MSVFLTALLALSTPATAQTGTQESLYSPARSILDQKITLRGWGSGSGSETDETYYEGAHSIRVSTRNYFQGAQIVYAAPIDLSNPFADKNNLLKIVVKTAGNDPLLGGGGTMGMPSVGGAPAFPGGGAPTGGRPGRSGAPSSPMGGMGGPQRGGSMGAPGGARPGGGMGRPQRGGSGFGQGAPMLPRMPGMPGGMGGGATEPATLSTVRVIVSTTDGKKSEAYLPIATGSSTDRGWKTVAIPLQAINGFDRTNKVVKDITFSGDVTTTFYVGDVRVVEDSTPIRGEIRGSRNYNLALGDKMTFTADGQGGSSVLEYVWDFDDTDGIQDDAIGQTVVHQFRNPSGNVKGGKFTVTLTIRDKYGLKPATTSTVSVVVNP